MNASTFDKASSLLEDAKKLANQHAVDVNSALRAIELATASTPKPAAESKPATQSKPAEKKPAAEVAKP